MDTFLVFTLALSLYISAGLKKKYRYLYKGKKFNFFVDFMFVQASHNIITPDFMPVFHECNVENIELKKISKRINLLILLFYSSIVFLLIKHFCF
jgi:hypothetical protein